MAPKKDQKREREELQLFAYGVISITNALQKYHFIKNIFITPFATRDEMVFFFFSPKNFLVFAEKKNFEGGQNTREEERNKNRG